MELVLQLFDEHLYAVGVIKTGLVSDSILQKFSSTDLTTEVDWVRFLDWVILDGDESHYLCHDLRKDLGVGRPYSVLCNVFQEEKEVAQERLAVNEFLVFYCLIICKHFFGQMVLYQSLNQFHVGLVVLHCFKEVWVLHGWCHSESWNNV